MARKLVDEVWRKPRDRGFRQYQVSDNGRIRSAATLAILHGSPEPNGSISVQLAYDDDGQPVPVKVSLGKLILETFDRKGRAGEIVRYLNNDRADTRPSNLEWWDKKKAAAAMKAAGAVVGKKKLTPAKAARLLKLKGKMSTREAGLKFGVTKATVSKVWRGETHAATA